MSGNDCNTMVIIRSNQDRENGADLEFLVDENILIDKSHFTYFRSI